jgi:hypothetical protein
MGQDAPPSGGLAVLAEAFRARRTGVLVVGQEPGAIRVRLEAGQIVALGPAAGDDGTGLPKPSDSVRLRLERVLAEIGMRRRAPPSAEPATPDSLADRLIRGLADLTHASRFENGAEAPQGLVAVTLATEPLILEAVRQLRHEEAVRQALGDLDRRLVATAALADERTLTLAEGYLLSRIDGLVSLREVLELAPLDPQEAGRALLGLVLTGRVECRPAEAKVQPPAPSAPPAALSVQEPAPAETADAASEAPEAEHLLVDDIIAEADDEEPLDDSPVVEAIPDDDVVETAEAPPAASDPPPAQPARQPFDPATIQRRREILEFFQALPLKNHFEVLGVEPGCDDSEVRRAYVGLAKRFHPDAHRDVRIEDMHDIMEAIFIRVGEAWEVLGEARSRASYEARSGIVRRPRTAPSSSASGGAEPTAGQQAAHSAAPQAAASPSGAPPLAPPPEPQGYVPPEEILIGARRLLTQARYWDAIQMLESHIPAMEPRAQQHRGRLLLARAYSKNPNWLRRAEEVLQQLLREDPTNADVHYELGLIYKAGGFVARAQGMFRRALELRPGHKEAMAQLGIQAEGQSPGLLKRLFKRGGPS